MVKIKFELIKEYPTKNEYVQITVIYRGTRARTHNVRRLSATKDFAEIVKLFIAHSTLKNLVRLMNYPNLMLGHSSTTFKDDIYEQYFFIMALIWAVTKELEPKKPRSSQHVLSAHKTRGVKT